MENLLHYVWKFKLFQKDLQTTTGLPIEVVDTGLSNTNEGPDFFNAKIKIGNKLWAGNIEIHSRSSDWIKHNHQTNKHYNSVILHVVEKADCDVYNELGNSLPQCEVVFSKQIKDNYDFLVHSDIDLPCSNYLGNIPTFHLKSWMENLLFERLERKSKHISDLLQKFGGSWDEVFYILLSRNFGFGLNADSFERLALSIPYKYIQKQNDNLIQIESMLFGQAGILETAEKKDKYLLTLQQEYNFLKNKYTLTLGSTFLFKKLRSRPSSFPEIRIAQLAALLHNSQSLFSKILDCEELGRIRLMFHVNASEYWQTHYSFGKECARKSKYLGDSSLDIILINTVIPILFSYGRYMNNEILCERAIQFLRTIKAEKNSISHAFSHMSVPLQSAADSQAVIQLKREYCEKRKCLYCRIGHQLLANNN